MYYTDDPALDAEYYYSSLPETVGICPFCGEFVQHGSNLAPGNEYIIGVDGYSVAHALCYDRALDDEFNMRSDLEVLRRKIKGFPEGADIIGVSDDEEVE